MVRLEARTGGRERGAGGWTMVVGRMGAENELLTLLISSSFKLRRPRSHVKR